MGQREMAQGHASEEVAMGLRATALGLWGARSAGSRGAGFGGASLRDGVMEQRCWLVEFASG
jgi:hypothetical protein